MYFGVLEMWTVAHMGSKVSSTALPLYGRSLNFGLVEALGSKQACATKP